MATVLDKELKRQITVDGVDYTVVVDPDGLRVVGKGKRKPEVELRWRDLLSGDAAMSVALNASLSATTRPPAAKPAKGPPAAKPAKVPPAAKPAKPPSDAKPMKAPSADKAAKPPPTTQPPAAAPPAPASPRASRKARR